MKTRTGTIRKLIGYAAIMTAAIILTTCDWFQVGLGDRVDVTPPLVEAKGPTVNSYVSGTFTLTGEVSDDRAVDHITVSYPHRGDGTPVTRNATFVATAGDATAGTWTISIVSGVDGAESVADGQNVMFTITAYDQTSPTPKTSTDTWILNVDNMPPTPLITAPLTYGASRPQQSDYLDVKGEVYDVSPIANVHVSIIDATTHLPIPDMEKDADGTNTWSTRFLLKDRGPFTSAAAESVFYEYTVVATDAAGNSSTYYYHRQDIFAILPADTLFPTMNDIGVLDQAGSGIAAVSKITYADLVLARKATGTAPLYADFAFKYESLPEITFTNLDRNGTQASNLLGIGAPITGLVTPPPGGGAVQANTIVANVYRPSAPTTSILTLRAVDDATEPRIEIRIVGDSVSFVLYLKDAGGVNFVPGPYRLTVVAQADGTALVTQPVDFIIDSTAPILGETNIGSSTQSRNAAFTLGGTILSSTNLATGTILVRQSFNDPTPAAFADAQTITIPDGTTTSYAWTSAALPSAVNGAGADGIYFYIITLNNSGKTATIERSVSYDRTGPSLAINSMNPEPESGTNYVNGVVQFSVGITDSNGIGEARWGLGTTQPTWAAMAANVLAAPYSGTLDTTAYGAGATNLWITARDKAGNESSISRAININQARDIPSITLTNMDAAGTAVANLQGVGAKVTGTVTDDDMIDASTLQINVDSGGWTNISGYANAKSISFQYNFTGLTQGAHSFDIRVYDLASAKQGEPAVSTTVAGVDFAYDTADPTLTIEDTSGAWARTSFVLNGTAQDTYGLDSVELSINSGVTWTSIGTWASVTGSQTWSYDLATHVPNLFGGAQEGTHTWQIRSVDAFDKTSVQTFVFKVDTLSESPVFTSPAANSYFLASAGMVQGTASDAGSGVNAVYYAVAAAEPAMPPVANRLSDAAWTAAGWTKANGTGVWVANLSGLAEGNRILNVRSVDIAGNASGTAVNRTFRVDLNNPAISNVQIDAVAFPAGTVYRNGAFVLSYSLADTFDLQSVTVTRNGTDITPALPDLSGAADTSATLTVNVGALASGAYQFVVTLTDGAGRTATDNRTVAVDTTVPTASVISVNPIIGANTVNGNLAIDFAASDDSSGIQAIRYWVLAAGSTPVWTTVGFTEITAPPYEVAAYDTGVMAGDYDVVILARDGATNVSTVTAAARKALHMDQSTDIPAIDVTNMLEAGTAVQNLQGVGAKVVGTMTDDDMVDASTLEINVDGGGWTAFGSYSDAKSVNFQYDFTGLTQGTHSYQLRVTDLASAKMGKPAATYTLPAVAFAYDTADPTLTIEDTSDAWHRASFIINGTAEDTYGLDSVDLSLDSGVTWTPIATWASITGSQTWSYNLATHSPNPFDGSHEGTYTWQIRSVDAFDKTTVQTFKFKSDTRINDPVFTSPGAGTFQTSSPVTVTGSASDIGTGSGILNVYYAQGVTAPAYPGVGWTAANGTTTWNSSIAMTQGNKRVWALAVDLAGNVSGSVSLDFLLDLANPTISNVLIDAVAFPAGTVYRSGAFTLSYSLADTFDLADLIVTQNGTDITPALPDLSGAADTAATLTVNVGSLASGVYEYQVTLTDGASRTVTDTKTVTVDTAIPTAEVISVSPIVGANTVNGNVSVKLSASDNYSISAMRYWVVATGSTPNWSDAGYVEIASPPYEAVFDTATRATGAWDLVALARDSATNVSTVTAAARKALAVDQATDTPAIDVTNMLEAGTAVQNLQGVGAKVVGTLTDDDMVDASTLEINVDGGGWTAFGSYSDAKSVNFQYDFTGLTQGTHSYQLRVTDLASAKMGKPAATYTLPAVAFAYDTADPALTIEDTSGAWARTAFAINGTAQDSYGLDSVDLSLDSGVTWTPIASWASVTGSQTWSYNLATHSPNPFDGTHEGTYSWQIRSVDAFDKTTVQPFVFKSDTLASDPSITSPAADSYFLAATGTVQGSSSDSGSGINAVYFAVAASEPAQPAVANRLLDAAWTGLGWFKANGSAPWVANLTGLAEGNRTVHVRSVDIAGNMSASAVNRAYRVDLSSPSFPGANPIRITDDVGQTNFINMPTGIVYRGIIFSLRYDLADTFDIASVSITQKLNSGSVLTIPITSTSNPNLSGANDVSAILTAANLPRNTSDLTVYDGSTSGTYTYVVTLTDGADRTATISKDITVDVADPVISIASFNKFVTSDEVNGTVTFTTTASDSSGIAAQRYFVTSADTAPAWGDPVGGNVVAIPAAASINTVLAPYIDGTTYYLWALAQDNSGRTAACAASTPFHINQASDRPILELDNTVNESVLSPGAIASGSNLFNGSSRISGLITDDDTIATAPLTTSISIWRSIGMSVTVNAGSDTFATVAAHGLSEDDVVYFRSGTSPGNIDPATAYYVMYVDANTFRVSATPAGGQIDVLAAPVAQDVRVFEKNLASAPDYGPADLVPSFGGSASNRSFYYELSALTAGVYYFTIDTQDDHAVHNVAMAPNAVWFAVDKALPTITNDHIRLENRYATSVAVTAVDASDTFTTAAPHGLAAGDAVMFSGSPLYGMSASAKYFVRAAGLTANAFTVATARGGALVPVTGDGAGLSIAYITKDSAAMPNAKVYNNFRVYVQATDDSGVSGVGIVLQGYGGYATPVTASFTSGGGNLWYYDIGIDEGGHADDGSLTMTITATDVWGNDRESVLQVTVDTNPPAPAFSSFSNNQAVNGTAVPVIGTINDPSPGVGVAYWNIAGGLLNASLASGTGNSWNTTFNANTYANASNATVEGVPVTVDTGTEFFDMDAANGIANGDEVYFYADTYPTNIAYGTVYYVINFDGGTNSFQVCADRGGTTAVDLGGSPANVLVREGGIRWLFPVTTTCFDVADNRDNPSLNLYLDPIGDRPKIGDTLMPTAGSYAGTINIIGSVGDDDLLEPPARVEVCADLNDDGIITDGAYPYNLGGAPGTTDPFETESNPLTIAMTGYSFSSSINAANEFNRVVMGLRAVPTPTGYFRLRFIAYDVNNVASNPRWVRIYLDDADPSIGGLNYATGSGALVRGAVTLSGYVEDDSVLTSANLRLNINNAGYSVAPDTFAFDAIYSGMRRYNFTKAIDTTAYDGTDNTGTVKVAIRIMDGMSQYSIENVNFNADNAVPTVDFYVPGTTNTQTLYTYEGPGTDGDDTGNELYGRATDLGTISGIDHVNLYFVKETSPGVFRFANPKVLGSYSSSIYQTVAGDELYNAAGSVATGVYFTEDTYRTVVVSPSDVNLDDDLINVALSFVDDNDLVSFAGTDLPGNLSAGIKYYLRNVTDTSFQVSLTSGGAAIDITDAGSDCVLSYENATSPIGTHYGITIDTRTELGVFDANLSLGDGDGFQESLKAKSGYEEWYSYFDTSKVADGQMDVYYVVYDEAGNKRYGWVDGQVANAPPSITSVSVKGSASVSALTTVSASTDTFTCVAHGFSAGDRIYFEADGLPGGLVTSTAYYVLSSGLTANAFKVSTTAGGLAVDISSSGTRIRVSESSLPFRYKTTKTAAAPFILTAVDPGDASVKTTGWDLDVLGDYGDGTYVGSGPNGPTWGYGVGSTTAFSGTFTVDLSSASFEGSHWYGFRGTTEDNDGNIITQDFFVRTMVSDTTPPSITMDTINQDSVDMWTSKSTPLSLSIDAATELTTASSVIHAALPAWIAAGTKVMFAGDRVPGDDVPGGFERNTVYFVRDIVASTSFALAATSDGAAINVDGAPSGTYYLVSGGHVENAGDSDYSESPDDADVSGAIRITGTVSDDSDVTSLGLIIGGTTVATMTYANGMLTNRTGNDIDGYTYDWSYIWDSSLITGVAGENVAIDYLASDGVPANNQGNFEYEGATVAQVTVDVLPYITSISDPNGLTNDVLRGATGKYSISSHGTNTLTVRGYNLGRPGFVPAVRNSATAISWATGTLGAVPDLNSVNEILVTKNWARSGWLTVVVNSQPSGNNLNANPNAAKTLHMNNDEAGTDPRSYQWTDDRYLWVWTATTVLPTGTSTLTYGATTAINVNNLTYNNPDMVMDGNQPLFAFNDDNNGTVFYTTGDAAVTRRNGFRLMRPAAFATATIGGGTYAGLQYFIASAFDSEYMTGDSSGMLEVTAFQNQQDDGYTRAYGPSVASDGIKWPTIQGNDYYAPGDTTTETYRTSNRFPHAKIIAEPSTIGANYGANIYLTYFDASIYHRSLNFVSYRMTGAGTTAAESNLSIITHGYQKSTDVIEIPGTKGTSSPYYGMAKVNPNGIAVAYYDEAAKVLRIAASADAFNTTGVVATENKSNVSTWTPGTSEISNVTITNVTRSNYFGKYFTVYNGLIAWDVWYRTAAGDPVAGPSTNKIEIDVSALAGNGTNTFRNNVRVATQTIVDATAAFAAAGTNPIAITSATVGNTTDIAGNLNTGTSVGTIAVATQGTNEIPPVGGATWHTLTVDSTGDVGQYVSIVADAPNGKLYVAYYDFDNSNLKMARISWNAGDPQLDGRVSVDNYLSAGSWTNIMLMKNDSLTGLGALTIAQPMIAYYADSYNGTKKPIRFAFPKFDATGSNTLLNGTLDVTLGDGADDKYSGNWEVMTVPAITTPKGGASTFNKVQLGKYATNTLPVVGWLGSKLEYSKLQPNN